MRFRLLVSAELNQDADGHDDLAILIRFLYNNTIYDPAFTQKFEKGGLEASVDLPRLKAGKVGGTFWSAFVPCPANSTDFANEAYTESKLESNGCYMRWPGVALANSHGELMY